MKIITAIDVINGKCVRLTKGDYTTKKIYSNDPIEVAKRFEDHGIKFLHLVDLDGAINKHVVNYKILERICSSTNLSVDFGGGIKAESDIQIAFECGAKQITAGSVAVNNPALFFDWINEYGAEKIILGADCKNRKIATLGWTASSEINVLDYIKAYEKKGVKNVICTDIEKDGMLSGTSDELYKTIIQQTNISLIASGGVSSKENLLKLKAIGCKGVIIGKAIYEGKIPLNKISEIC